MVELMRPLGFVVLSTLFLNYKLEILQQYGKYDRGAMDEAKHVRVEGSYVMPALENTPSLKRKDTQDFS